MLNKTLNTQSCSVGRAFGKYSLEICVFHVLGTKFQLEIVSIHVISGIVYFREIILESSLGVIFLDGRHL